MTQTLKFRCLDTETNQWLYFTLEQLAHGEAAKIGHRLEHWGQWTGLTDKNKFDVYDGDIVKHYFSPGRETIFTIYPANNLIDILLQLRIKRYGSVETPSLYDLNDKLEVVGNVFQDKELLQ